MKTMLKMGRRVETAALATLGVAAAAAVSVASPPTNTTTKTSKAVPSTVTPSSSRDYRAGVASLPGR